MKHCCTHDKQGKAWRCTYLLLLLQHVFHCIQAGCKG